MSCLCAAPSQSDVVATAHQMGYQGPTSALRTARPLATLAFPCQMRAESLLDIQSRSMNPIVACIGLVTSAFPCQMRTDTSVSPPRLFLASRSSWPQLAVARLLPTLSLNSAFTKCLWKGCLERRSLDNWIPERSEMGLHQSVWEEVPLDEGL